jgi:alpha-tubulin suppressor-like RCC1 family protein
MDKTDGRTSTKLDRASVVAAGNEHACAISGDGEVQCWGKNVRGALGRDTPKLEDPTPGRVEWRPSSPAASPHGAERSSRGEAQTGG